MVLVESYKNGYDLFNDQLDDVVCRYPKLKKELGEDCKFFLRGEIEIIDLEGKYWDSFQIEIHCSKDFPKRFPKVYEIGGKIPAIGDWHVFEDTKACCIKVLPEEIITCKNNISLLDFISEEVFPYFFNQTHRIVEGYYVNGEYSHGVKGIYEFYSDVLSIKDVNKLAEMMYLISKSPKPERTNSCFCGSGKKFRKCHRESYLRLANLDFKLLTEHALLIYKSHS